jgi:2-C-methyl-D-erythritol 4-phosphate cytidylyltransferase
MPALKVHDTVKKVENGLVKETLDRSKLYLAQTPQGFCFHTILKLHQKYENKQ